jgi:hypothetical protein
LSDGKTLQEDPGTGAAIAAVDTDGADTATSATHTMNRDNAPNPRIFRVIGSEGGYG